MCVDRVGNVWPQAGGRADQDEQHKRRIRETVNVLLSGVSEEDRILLLLKEVEGLSLKELEKIYNVKENALKVRLFRARQRVLKAHEAAEEQAAKQRTPNLGVER